MCALLNADKKLSDEEQTLLLLASLPKSYRSIIQTILTRREFITSDLIENDKFMVKCKGEEKNSGERRLIW